MLVEALSDCLEPLRRHANCRILDAPRCSLQCNLAVLQGSALSSKREAHGSWLISAAAISMAKLLLKVVSKAAPSGASYRSEFRVPENPYSCNLLRSAVFAIFFLSREPVPESRGPLSRSLGFWKVTSNMAHMFSADACRFVQKRVFLSAAASRADPRVV